MGVNQEGKVYFSVCQLVVDYGMTKVTRAEKRDLTMIFHAGMNSLACLDLTKAGDS